MQRLLRQLWSIEIVNKFRGLKVRPIQVYKPDPTKDEYVAWDGQHTLVALWIIATQIFGEDPDKIMIPVNLYRTNDKAEMRDSFIGHNGGEYQEQLDQFDKIEQIVYGVRVDGSKNPEWLKIEEKQSVVESYDLFLTKADFGDADLLWFLLPLDGGVITSSANCKTLSKCGLCSTLSSYKSISSSTLLYLSGDFILPFVSGDNSLPISVLLSGFVAFNTSSEMLVSLLLG
jgi:hypothetical protein